MQSMLPVVKLQVFFWIQTLYTVGKSGILNKVCRKLFWQCGRQIILLASADRCRKEEETMNRSSRTVKLVEMALLVAIILILAFTPLGYIKTLGLEITLIVVPVTIGAIILGPLGGAVLGAVFGITSFIQCFGMSPFGAVLLGINPFGTFVVCVVSRILMGWLTGLIYKGLSKFPKMKNWKILIANLAGPILNTFFFMSTLVIFFFSSDYIQSLAGGLIHSVLSLPL